jgi:hypothetical protein
MLVLVLAACGGTSHSAGTTATTPTTTTISGPKSALTMLLPPAIQSAGVIRIAVGPSAGDAALARRLAKALGVRLALQHHATGASALGTLAGHATDVAVARGATRAGVTLVDRPRGVAVARGAAMLAAAVRAALAAP